jgi:hypothetical protein
MVAVRQHLRPCEASAGRPDSLGKWTGMRVARPLFRFGLPSEALSPNKTSPPSHKAMEGILRSVPTMSAQSEGWKTGVCLSTPMPVEMACQPKLRGSEGSPPSLKLRLAAFARRGAESEGWNPVLESHQPVRFCKPPPGLLGQRDNRVKHRRPTKDQNLCRADLGSPADSSIRGLNRSRSPRCNACARESRAERGSLRPTHPDRKQTPA